MIDTSKVYVEGDKLKITKLDYVKVEGNKLVIENRCNEEKK